MKYELKGWRARVCVYSAVINIALFVLLVPIEIALIIASKH